MNHTVWCIYPCPESNPMIIPLVSKQSLQLTYKPKFTLQSVFNVIDHYYASVLHTWNTCYITCYTLNRSKYFVESFLRNARSMSIKQKNIRQQDSFLWPKGSQLSNQTSTVKVKFFQPYIRLLRIQITLTVIADYLSAIFWVRFLGHAFCPDRRRFVPAFCPDFVPIVPDTLGVI